MKYYSDNSLYEIHDIFRFEDGKFESCSEIISAEEMRRAKKLSSSSYELNHHFLKQEELKIFRAILSKIEETAFLRGETLISYYLSPRDSKLIDPIAGQLKKLGYEVQSFVGQDDEDDFLAMLDVFW